jgi:hypothetical protein
MVLGSVETGPVVRQNIMASGASGRGDYLLPHPMADKKERERERERERETERHRERERTSNDLPPPLGPHLLKCSPFPKRAPPPGNQAFNT